MENIIQAGDLVRYKSFPVDFVDCLSATIGQAVHVTPQGSALVRWWNHPHEEVIGEKVAYHVSELIKVRNL
jgi:hypothetical protein|tara:strand:+ start:613 stop:825 length:213 start_codon:yes stop_codon:yes gene_type:complete